MARADLWIFGYGSLVWRPAFAHAERYPGFIRGYHRRFWQGSIDHRGIPGAPGRVVTLTPATLAVRCWGMVYRVEPGYEDEVLTGLDHREKGGYERREVDVERRDGANVEALVYLATPSNPQWLGDAHAHAIVAQIRHAVGPSGANLEYLVELHRALEAMDATDDHVTELVDLLELPGK